MPAHSKRLGLNFELLCVRLLNCSTLTREISFNGFECVIAQLQASLQEHTAAVLRDVEVRENVATCQAGLEAARSRSEAAQHTVHRETQEHMEAMAHQRLCTELVRSQHLLSTTFY